MEPKAGTTVGRPYRSPSRDILIPIRTSRALRRRPWNQWRTNGKTAVDPGRSGTSPSKRPNHALLLHLSVSLICCRFRLTCMATKTASLFLLTWEKKRSDWIAKSISDFRWCFFFFRVRIEGKKRQKNYPLLEWFVCLCHTNFGPHHNRET